MKKFVKSILATILVAVVTVVSGCGASGTNWQELEAVEHSASYTVEDCIVSLNVSDNTLIFESPDGNIWAVENTVSAVVGDTVTAVFNDASTVNDITDDIVLSVSIEEV
jgi:hypothetical protein